MKTVLFSYIIFSFFSFINAQTININYQVTVNPYSYTCKRSVYKYILSGTSSLYYNDVNDINIFPFIDWEPEIIKEKKGVKTVKIDDGHIVKIMQEYLYKNYNTETIIYNKQLVFSEVLVIKEPLQLFSWQIMPNVDTLIMGYHCQKAKASFRGREYMAYFTSDINMFGGPWKFDGLPGLILSVKDNDKYFIIEPIKLSVSENNTPIKNPFAKERDVISWDEYKKAYFEKMKDILKLSKTNSSAGESTKLIIKSGIEDLGFKQISTDDL